MPRTARSLPAPCARPPSTKRAGHAHGVTGASWTTKHSQTWSPTHGSPTHKRDFLKLYLMKSENCAFKSLLGFLLRRVYILASGITKNRDFPDFIDLRKCASLRQSCELSAQIFHDGRLRGIQKLFKQRRRSNTAAVEAALRTGSALCAADYADMLRLADADAEADEGRHPSY